MKYMYFGAVVAKALFCAGLTTAAALQQRASTSFKLFAYGGDGTIDGLPVFYSDGLAYAGWKTPSGSSVNTNITVAQTSSSLTIASRNNSTPLNGTSLLYIDVSSAAYSAVGFTATDAAPTKMTTGFIFYGSWAMWEDSAGKITSLFYATPTAQEGLYLLKWNQGVVDDGKSISISLKKRSV
ncbi:hypothetical protein BP6252_06933 [Coleophoma cylindrospora]|uniref:Cytochrome p450 protein n=1 Tax=Coleophoma cylindrospora TaxID=1849047 RepID=A0A3D8RGD7_9HELO|nr:hypothetical protein BP6252_06933 [Coleophoma cylindrospora]